MINGTEVGAALSGGTCEEGTAVPTRNDNGTTASASQGSALNDETAEAQQSETEQAAEAQPLVAEGVNGTEFSLEEMKRKVEELTEEGLTPDAKDKRCGFSPFCPSRIGDCGASQNRDMCRNYQNRTLHESFYQFRLDRNMDLFKQLKTVEKNIDMKKRAINKRKKARAAREAATAAPASINSNVTFIQPMSMFPPMVPMPIAQPGADWLARSTESPLDGETYSRVVAAAAAAAATADPRTMHMNVPFAQTYPPMAPIAQPMVPQFAVMLSQDEMLATLAKPCATDKPEDSQTKES